MDEGGLYPESDDTFGQVTISAYKLGTAIKVSEELINDSVFDLESYIAAEFARRVGTKEEEAFITGNGTGKPTGVFTSAESAVTTAGTTITFDDVMDLYHSLRAPYRHKAVWLLNDTTVKALRKLKDGNGNYIWQPSVVVGQPDMILNRPYYTSNFIPDMTAGNKVMAFGDNYNDEDMLRAVEHGYLMANAPEPLLRRLPLHTLDHNHDGIYAALREAGLVE